MKRTVWLMMLFLFVVGACSPQVSLPETPPAHTMTAAPTQSPPQPTQSPVPSHTPAPSTMQETPVPTIPPLEICSPLEGFALTDLPSIISNPYDEPLPGMDDGHHGIDYAFYSYPPLGLTQMKGLPIHSVLNGEVVMASRDLDPYGYTVIIETPLDMLPVDFTTAMQFPHPQAFPTQVAPLICPELPVPADWDNSRLSLYLLYAHMDQPPGVHAGQSVTCGQAIGGVGTTGLSVNEHLHFEVRVGPSGAAFDNMGHYTTAATEEERHNYCLWRISGWFPLTDPARLLQQPGD